MKVSNGARGRSLVIALSSAAVLLDGQPAVAVYGPATVFGGIWPQDAPSAPPSGSLTSEIACAFGDDGHVTASTSVTRTPEGPPIPAGSDRQGADGSS